MTRRACACGAAITKHSRSGRCRVCANRATGAALSAAARASIPAERWPEYRKLRRQLGSAEQARAVIEADR